MTTSPDTKPTLVIGDTHGHLDRLEALLKQEGIIARCLRCDGTGDIQADNLDPSPGFCSACEGDGITRTLKPATVVHLGDVGHFGYTSSPTGDMLTYKYARKWCDIVLWGNHDRAVIDAFHRFNGYDVGFSNAQIIRHMMAAMVNEGKMRLAYAAHGHLMTHAGLHYEWTNQKDIDFPKDDPYAFADWINENDWYPEGDKPGRRLDGSFRGISDVNQADIVRDAISWYRGGNGKMGGILWRDRAEPLYFGFPQIFGHSADRSGFIRYFTQPNEFEEKLDFFLEDGEEQQPEGKDWSVCIDIGGKDEARLAAIWLPEKRIVRVDL